MLACVRPPEYHVLTCTRRYPDTRTVTISQNLCAKLYLYCAAFLRNAKYFQLFCYKDYIFPFHRKEKPKSKACKKMERNRQIVRETITPTIPFQMSAKLTAKESR